MDQVTTQHIIDNTVFTPVNATYQHDGMTVAITAAESFSVMYASTSDASGEMAYAIADGEPPVIATVFKASANMRDSSGCEPSEKLIEVAREKVADQIITALERHARSESVEQESTTTDE